MGISVVLGSTTDGIAGSSGTTTGFLAGVTVGVLLALVSVGGWVEFVLGLSPLDEKDILRKNVGI